MTGDVTELLRRYEQGDDGAPAHLISLLYPQLRRIAEGRMRTERAGHTLQPTALVNEFFLQLARHAPLSCRSRWQFLAAASVAMRRLLIDYARAHRADKRGGNVLRVEMEDFAAQGQRRWVDIAEMGDLLEKLAAEEPRMAQVVDLRCFGGLTHAEIGEALGVDERTVKRDWQVARAWLRGHLTKK
ncbi:MAG: ECF-type sigma factor [Candidatus Solibacter sp.]